MAYDARRSGCGGRSAAARGRSSAGGDRRHAAADRHGVPLGRGAPRRGRGPGCDDAHRRRRRAGHHLHLACAEPHVGVPERRVGDVRDDAGHRGRIGGQRCGQLPGRATRRGLELQGRRVDTARRHVGLGDAEPIFISVSIHAAISVVTLIRTEFDAGSGAHSARVHGSKPGGRHPGRRRTMRERLVGHRRVSLKDIPHAPLNLTRVARYAPLQKGGGVDVRRRVPERRSEVDVIRRVERFDQKLQRLPAEPD